MKTTLPAKDTEVCDFCRREGYLQECDVCGKQYCLSDQGTVAASYGFYRLCRNCAGREDVKAICDKYATKLMPIFKERDAALKRLRAIRCSTRFGDWRTR